MTRAEAVVRARSACGHGCIYKLGQGGMKPLRTVPWDDEMECDCSGFAMWCIGLSRFDADSGLWYDTSRIHAEAKAGSSFFTQREWKQARIADFLVYPDHAGKQGHVGIVTDVGPDGPLLMVDCSMGSWRTQSDAILEHDPGLFFGRGIVAGYTRFMEVA